MKTLLRLQEQDLEIHAMRAKEKQIPDQKKRFETQRRHLEEGLAQREAKVKELQVQQRTYESEIEQFQATISKYEGQLHGVKKNEEYQALLHEIDSLRKQVNQREEQILALMMEIEEARDLLNEEKTRVAEQVKGIEAEMAAIDAELAEAKKKRQDLEGNRTQLSQAVDAAMLRRYDRVRKSGRILRAVVPLRGDVCSGCNMNLRPQFVNEILAGEPHSCHHCGRILYNPDLVDYEPAGQE